MKKRLLIGLGSVVDKNWNPVMVTRQRARALTKKLADKSLPMFAATVCDCGEYWRGNYGAQPERIGP